MISSAMKNDRPTEKHKTIASGPQLDAAAPNPTPRPRVGGSTTTNTGKRSERNHTNRALLYKCKLPAKYEIMVFPASDPDAAGLVGSGKNPKVHRPRRPEIPR
jgi:hypothetical protein